ncbi:MAG: radical SAM protein [Phascolarctobacterium sp.]|nr:radical SAM protein [Phascolarctobacterium sp.]
MAIVPIEHRYSKILEKNQREIVLLRGSGCKWRRCRFCDYHLDFCLDDKENFDLNSKVLAQVTGEFGRLEVINSGSFCDLDEGTLSLILETCLAKGITTLYFECHWLHRELIADFKKKFADAGIKVKMKIGVETFDSLFRESYLDKGLGNATAEEIAQYFQQVCLLQGLPGQSKESMLKDIALGLQHFERVCVNIMVANTKPILPDQQVIETFVKEIYPLYKDDERVDILLNNTDFGVGV